MTTTDAARIARLTRQAIWRAIQTGTLPAVKVGRDWQITQADLNKWLAAPKNKGGRPRKEATK